VAGGSAGAAAVAFFFVDLNDFANHVGFFLSVRSSSGWRASHVV
jgi:hypothetical protein